MTKKMKRSLSPSQKSDEAEDPGSVEKKRPWWARSDDELVKERVDKIKDWYDSSKIKLDEEDRDEIIREAAKRDPRIQNLLDMVIVKAQDLQRNKEFLMVPIYSTSRGEKIASALRLKTTRRIKLDQYGWGVWDLIDGQRDVRSIGKLLSSRFGEDVEPLYPRLAKFLAYLQNLKLIRITEREK